MNIIKYYLVDSENVNDNWLMLLDLANAEDEIIIFYTKNSPHMSYMSVVKLLGNTTQKITFEECFEGNNALDFQLISYMGYLMNEDSLKDDTEYVVMSNDTGFDAAVKFWKKKGFAVRRVNVNFCKIALHKQKTTETESPVRAEISAEAETPVEAGTPLKAETPVKAATPIEAETPMDAKTSVDAEFPVGAETETSMELDIGTGLPEFAESEENSSTDSEDSETVTYLPEFAETEEQLSLTFEDMEADTAEKTAVDKESSHFKEEENSPIKEEDAFKAPARPEDIKAVTYLPEFAEREEGDSKDPEKSTHLPEFVQEEKEASPYPFNKEEVDEIINCITKDSLESLHETLVHIYGRDQGQKIYKTIKSSAYPYKQTIYSRKEKVTHITDIIFLHSELENPGDFVDFLEKNKNKTKNLNGIRSAINKTYGSANGIKYYSLFKPYFKIISAMK